MMRFIFSAPFRGQVCVDLLIRNSFGFSTEEAARDVHREAVHLFAAHWTFPKYDQAEMKVSGFVVSDDEPPPSSRRRYRRVIYA